jgi:hypothetical protein
MVELYAMDALSSKIIGTAMLLAYAMKIAIANAAAASGTGRRGTRFSASEGQDLRDAEATGE